MKVTVENDKGERKEFECDGLALVTVKGDDVRSIIEGRCSTIQMAGVCAALMKSVESIFEKDKGVEILVRMSELGDTNKENEDDKS